MKSSRNQLPLFLSLLLLLPVARASAYYDPGVQRWINRDPLAGEGFKTMGVRGPYFESGRQLEYTFVNNQPCSNVDSVGLYLWGKNCSQSDIKEIKKALAYRCQLAKQGNCFRCLSPKKQHEMQAFCDDTNSRNVTIRCDNASSNPDCKNPDTGGRSGAGSYVIHVCMDNIRNGKADIGCVVLHEAGHAVGGVGGDEAINGNNDSYAIEKCAGCPVDPKRPMPPTY